MKIARRLLLLGLIIFAIVNCDQVDFQAPTGATLAISIQPQSVANNGNANITVVGTRANGAPLPDDTLIQFTTDLGTVTPNPAKTDNGVATATFRAGVRSGTATITASSGSADAVNVEVVIGEARASQNLVLITTPSTLPFGGGTIRLTAHVTDEDGNPLGGIAVFFETTAGELSSGGRAVRTNDAGVATDTLTTTIDADVTVTTANGQGTDTKTVDVSPGEGPECNFVFSPPNPQPGETVIFTSTSTNQSPIQQFLWDFGDGDTAEGPVVEHEFATAGTFTVVLTVVDEFGFSTICTEEVDVQLELPDCSFEVTPDEPDEGSTVFFDASESSDESGIATFQWSFGDGQTETTTTPFTQHVYNFADCGGGSDRSVQVSLIVTNNEGSSNFCSREVTIACQ